MNLLDVELREVVVVEKDGKNEEVLRSIISTRCAFVRKPLSNIRSLSAPRLSLSPSWPRLDILNVPQS
jgi:hypothetical protein